MRIVTTPYPRFSLRYPGWIEIRPWPLRRKLTHNTATTPRKPATITKSILGPLVGPAKPPVIVEVTTGFAFELGGKTVIEFVPELVRDAALVSDKVLILYTALVPAITLVLDTSTEVPSKVVVCVMVGAELAVFTAIAPSLQITVVPPVISGPLITTWQLLPPLGVREEETDSIVTSSLPDTICPMRVTWADVMGISSKQKVEKTVNFMLTVSVSYFGFKFSKIQARRWLWRNKVKRHYEKA